jgi:predicted transcriptional regulator
MKELRTVVSDEEFAALEQLAQEQGVSMEELFKWSLA